MHLRSLSLCITLALAISAIAQEAPAPIAPSRMQDGRIVSAEDNFSMKVPPGEWQWFEKQAPEQKITSFTGVEQGSGTIVTITATRRIFNAPIQEFADGVAAGARNSVTQLSGTVVIHGIDSAANLLDGAVLIRSTVTLPEREPLHSQTLVVKRGYTYAIQAMSPDDPSATIGALAAGFELLEEPKIAPVDFSKGLSGTAIGCFGMMLVSLLVNGYTKRRTMNGAAWTAYLIIFLFALTSAMLAMTVDRSADAGLQGEAFGEIFGSVVIQLAIAILLARRFERQRVVERRKARMTAGPTAGASLLLGYILLLAGALILGISYPAAKAGIAFVAIAQFLSMSMAVVVFIRDARQKEFLRLKAEGAVAAVPVTVG